MSGRYETGGRTFDGAAEGLSMTAFHSPPKRDVFTELRVYVSSLQDVANQSTYTIVLR